MFTVGTITNHKLDNWKKKEKEGIYSLYKLSIPPFWSMY